MVRPAYGYRIVAAADGSNHTELAINDKEVNVLRRVATLIVDQGESAYSVAPILNADGVRSRRRKATAGK